MKLGFENRRQEQSDDFLGDAIPNDRNAEWSKLCGTGAFGDKHAFERIRTVGAVLEIPHEGVEILIKLLLEQGDADAIDTRSTAIPLDRSERFAHHQRSDSAGERVNFDFVGHKRIPGRREPVTNIIFRDILNAGFKGLLLSRTREGGSQASQARAWADAYARHLDANWPHGPSLVVFRHHWFSLSLATGRRRPSSEYQLLRVCCCP